MNINAYSRAGLWLLLGSLAAGATEAGQATPAAPAVPADRQAVAPQAPVVPFEPQGIALSEAVRLTLQHAPTIQLAEAAARQQSGVAQEQAGAFDTALLAGGNYDYRRQRLTESAILGETLKRENLAAARDDNRATAVTLQALRTQLQGIQNNPVSQAQLAELRRLDPVTAANLRMIEAFRSANFGGEPLAQNLSQIQRDLITDTVASAETGISAAESAFAQLDQIVTRLGVAPNQEYFLNGGGDVRISKFFRSGVSFAPFFDGTDRYSNYIDKPFSAEFGGKGIYPLYTFRTGMNVVLPLARGFGADAVGGPERSSLLSAQAGRVEVDHEAAASALDTIRAYWSLRAAQENVGVAQQSVDRQTRMVELTQGLISIGDLPEIEVARVQASEARARAELRDAERALHEARVRLATVMGIATTGDDATLPTARDPFPPPPDPAAADEQRLIGLAAGAAPQRRDVEAALRRQEAASVLERSAALNLKPRLDVIGETFYTALDEAAVGRAISRWVGPSYNVTVDFERPFGNNVQRGRLVQAEAGSALSQIAAQDLQRQVRLSVVRTVRSLQEAVERLRHAEAAVNLYQQMIDGEIERFQLGEVTLIDTITTESQQTDARRVLIAAQQDVAQLIAELRFHTGTLVTGPRADVSPDALVTLPN